MIKFWKTVCWLKNAIFFEKKEEIALPYRQNYVFLHTFSEMRGVLLLKGQRFFKMMPV